MNEKTESLTDLGQLIENTKKFHKKAQDLFKEMKNFMDRTSRHVLELKKENIEMKNILAKSIELSENVDITLCKVLLAINQREYLHAWYPELEAKSKKVINE